MPIFTSMRTRNGHLLEICCGEFEYLYIDLGTLLSIPIRSCTVGDRAEF
jgi:hypothetical protein